MSILKIMRIDGYYVFWQSSGQDGDASKSSRATAVFLFDFTPNLFGAADYEVTVDLGTDSTSRTTGRTARSSIGASMR